jgi:pyruvate/2-oxoglutarate dehydrogenase complex dihydrolipoamide acyltransferase (E2) component
VPFLPERQLVVDALRVGRGTPMMNGLLELDVTRARRILREHRERTGESISFTGFVIRCLGKAVAAHPEVHALRDWRGRLVLYDDVDAATVVEVEVDGGRFPLAHIVRGAQRRTVRDIHTEIRSVQASGVRSVTKATRVSTRLMFMVPGPLRRLPYRAVRVSPWLAKQQTGTMLVTAVGMFGRGAGWGVTAPGVHNLSVIIGGIASRPSPESAGREVLCLTISANHDVVDGAPLARFASYLAELLEAADGLEEARSLTP